MLRRVEAQPVLFAPKISRLALQKLDIADEPRQSLQVNVWRNHAIENLLGLAQPFFAYGRIAAGFHISDYDDSLMFAGHQSADVELLWLDSERYLAASAAAEWLTWLEGRVRALRAISKAPIVIASWMAVQADDIHPLQALADAVPAVYFADLAAVCAEAGVALTDQRSAAAAGTPLANAAQPLLARKLACHWLPAAALPPVKAIALDLDHTLHAGVLGEDGVDGVQLTAEHASLQQMLAGLRERGIFLALVSRNEMQDAEALFAQRSDYPLKWSDFSAIEVSWDPKAQALSRVAQALRIAPDAILFVDDNPGELASVAAALDGIKTVHADAALTRRAIEFYPGLWRWRVDVNDAKRVQDLQANAERIALQADAADSSAYFRSLQVALGFSYDPLEQLARVAELCRKTNQFNLAMRRFTEAEVADRMALPSASVASISMKDRLSDSGMIGLIIAEREGSRLRIEELCISCRAMGRQLEDTMILGVIAGMPQFDGCTELAFVVRHGPRNQPALEWLGKLLDMQEAPAEGEHLLPADILRRFVPDSSVTITKDNKK
ncbi:haloacid dehalogenase [Undibacterium terreum]|uniref:Haloacid dehalogenase n=2 Tax=Undibacterium terreum TaxID=1224302 RepID=A0A916V0D7_9BURK|nr:haloacid dehalogenase [Undibacterium terreum]